MTVAAPTGLERIARAFARAREERRLAVVIYLTVGYPDRASTAGLLRAALDGGADLLELGVPFSDPLADGATVQRASEVALAGGTSLRDCLAEARGLMAEYDAPVIFMGYLNPFLRYGLTAFARDAASAGAVGVIVPDLPAEESADLDAALASVGLTRIDLYASTTPEDRLARLVPRSRGFVYCVSVTGVTGARAALAEDVGAFVARVRVHTALPIAVGFGISRPDQVASLRDVADGVVVGSAAIDVVTNAPRSEGQRALREFVASLVAAGRR
ncbi:MAG: tryptophan synthase subunit alpha [Chloroflexi bacterium]|nr:tryptophan synthase subunit alpha [Chloroflexota bacterium]